MYYLYYPHLNKPVSLQTALQAVSMMKLLMLTMFITVLSAVIIQKYAKQDTTRTSLLRTLHFNFDTDIWRSVLSK